MMAYEVSRMSSMRHILLLLVIASAAIATGCEDQLADGLPGYPDCSACHGDETSPSPPKGLNGETTTNRIEVGAHRSHLTDGELRKAIDCNECHLVPETVDQEGHIDPKPADLTFGDLTTAHGVTPIWDRSMLRCVDTYCHGATLGGGTNKLPIWNRVGLGEAACGTCHGSPPPPPHVGNTDCNQCHPDSVTATGEIDVEGGYHINGVVEVSGMMCNTCHGNEDNAAPPISVEGSSDTSDVDVGAHQSHLGASDWHHEITCEDCHVLPATVEEPGHIDLPPAEITWGTLADADDATPDFDHDAETCTGVYCHGPTLIEGGTINEPAWTTVDGSQAACGACHALPPDSPHPVGSSCGSCHGDVINTDSTWADPDRHIDGIVDVNLACNSCHGSVDNDAPPLDTSGNSDATLTTVGAHQAHLGTSSWHNEIVCQDCHIVPATVGDPGHLDTAPADITWSLLSQADSATPNWVSASETCTGTYCHGTTLYSGGSLTEPFWTNTASTAGACGACHALPPDSPHPAGSSCGSCHGDVINTDSTWADPDRHIDGIVDVNLACNSCHGSLDNDAPPLDTSGNSSTALTTVGAHQSHLTDGAIRLAFNCDECHVIPTTVGEPAHIDPSPAELTWSTLTTAGGTLTPDWSVTTAGECTNTYCHGATLGGGTNKTPDWTTVGLGEAACGTCHGSPPPQPHPQQTTCNPCHPQTVTALEVIDVAGGFHIDGLIQAVSPSCASDVCHALPPLTGSHLVHFSALTSDATYGGTEDTADLLPGNTAYAFNCGNCHPLPIANHNNGVPNAGGGTAEIDLSPAGAPVGSMKEMHLSTASYTPGATTFLDADGFAFTLGTCADVYCHSELTVDVPGPVDEPVSAAPGPGEFLFTGYPIDYYPAYTETFGRVYTTPTWGDTLFCNSCHGFPPRNTDLTVAAGAGASHSWIDDQNYENLHGWNMGFDPLACATCHHGTATSQGVRTRDLVTDWSIYQPVPIDGFLNHVNGQPDVAFTTDNITYNSTFNLAAATYNDVTETCSNVSCHLNDTSAVWGRPYRWWNNIECNVCHQY